ELVFKSDPAATTYAEWLRADRDQTREAIDFTTRIFQLIGNVAPHGKTKTQPGPPEEVIVRLLSVLAGNPDSSAAAAAARALYVFAGNREDWSRDWNPPHADDVVRQGLLTALTTPALDPLCARYLLYILSRCRDVSGEPDVIYELAYALDKGLNPASQVT